MLKKIIYIYYKIFSFVVPIWVLLLGIFILPKENVQKNIPGQKNLQIREDAINTNLAISYFLTSPYDYEYEYQYKVNLHAQTTERDENYAYPPKELLEKALVYGFDAYAITDLPEAGGIVEDPGVDGILYIPGIEYGGEPHLIGLGINTLTNSSDKQVQIDHIKHQGGLAYIPHPHFGNYDENIIGQYEDYDGIAVFNSLTYGVAVYEGKESEVILYNEDVIDKMLSRGRKIVIMSEEDTKYEYPHDYGHQLNTSWMNVWGSIPPKKIEVDDILDAIKEGKFTSHARHLRDHPKPPKFLDISTNGLSLRVEIDKESDIEFITGMGERKKVIKNATEGSYIASPEDVYVRVKVTYTDCASSWAWTNPLYIESQITDEKI